jgi:hypothetical protein
LADAVVEQVVPLAQSELTWQPNTHTWVLVEQTRYVPVVPPLQSVSLEHAFAGQLPLGVVSTHVPPGQSEFEWQPVTHTLEIVEQTKAIPVWPPLQSESVRHGCDWHDPSSVEVSQVTPAGQSELE